MNMFVPAAIDECFLSINVVLSNEYPQQMNIPSTETEINVPQQQWNYDYNMT